MCEIGRMTRGDGTGPADGEGSMFAVNVAVDVATAGEVYAEAWITQVVKITWNCGRTPA